MTHLRTAWTGAAAAGDFIDSSPAVADGVAYISGTESVFAFAVGCGTGGSTCSPLWTGPVGDTGTQSPAVDNGVVYVASDSRLDAFAVGCRSDGGACTPTWTSGTVGSDASPAVADGVVYITYPGRSSSAPGKVYAYQAGCGTAGATCDPVWTGSTSGFVESSPAVAGGVVYVSSCAPPT